MTKVRTRRAPGILILSLLALASVGLVSWLLSIERPPTDGAAVDSTFEQGAPESGSEPLEERRRDSQEDRALGIETISLMDGPSSAAHWLSRLESALEGGDARRAESARAALRTLIFEGSASVKEWLGLAPSERTRAEVLPLFLDVDGLASLKDPEVWLKGASPELRAAVYARLARSGRDGRLLLAKLLEDEADRGLGSDAILFLLKNPRDGEALASEVARSEEALVTAGISALMLRPGDTALRDRMRRYLDRRLRFDIREALVDTLAASYQGELRNAATGPEDFHSRAADSDLVVKTLALRTAGNFLDAYKKGQPDPNEITQIRERVRNALYRDPDPLVRRSAILSRVAVLPDLSDLAGQCRALLEMARTDADPGVRAAVLLRVHRGSAHTTMPFGPDYLAPYLESEPEPLVRIEAVRTLPRYLGRGEAEAHARRMLVQALNNDPNADVRFEAAAALTELGLAEAKPHLERAARSDRDPEFRERLYEAIRDQLAPFDQGLRESLQEVETHRKNGVVDYDVEVAQEGHIPVLRVTPKSAARESRNSLSTDGEEARRPTPTFELPQSPVNCPVPTTTEVRIIDTAFFVPADGIWLSARYLVPLAPCRSLLVVAPADPLLFGATTPFSLDDWIALAKAEAQAILLFDHRGRGGSEGFSGRTAGELRDLETVVLAGVQAIKEGSPDPSLRGLRLRVLLAGPSAALLTEALATVDVLREAEMQVEGLKPSVAAARVMERWFETKAQARLLAWLRSR